LPVVAEHVLLRPVRNMRKATTIFVLSVSSSVWLCAWNNSAYPW